MTLNLATEEEVATLWAWITANPELHMDDFGPKTLAQFVEQLELDGTMIIAVKLGRKFIGAIGFNPGARMIKGIHLIEAARGHGWGYSAVKGLLLSLYPHTIRLKYFVDNPNMPKLVQRLGGKNVEGGGTTFRNGVEVAFQLVEFAPCN